MGDTWKVSLPLEQATYLIHDTLVKGSVTGELIDWYNIAVPGGAQCVVMVFEKHYIRVSNRLTLTATVDNVEGYTRVHAIGGGGGEGLLRFDWGAAGNFMAAVEGALQPYIR